MDEEWPVVPDDLYLIQAQTNTNDLQRLTYAVLWAGEQIKNLTNVIIEITSEEDE
jgi:hypothetical protein